MNAIKEEEEKIPPSDDSLLISLLNNGNNLFVFSEKENSIQKFELPFFKNYLYLKVWVHSSIPPISLFYLWDRKNDIFAIDGTKERIFENLPKLGLVLNSKTIVPYLRFVLDCVWSSEGSLRLTEYYDEITFSCKPTDDEMNFLLKNIRPAKVTPSENGYNIDATVIFGDSVFQSKIVLQDNGIFEIESENRLCEGYRCLRPIFLE